MLRRRVDYDIPDQVRVLPNMGRPERLELRNRSLLQLESGSRRVRRVGNEGEFERLRAYVPGDDPRHVDWKATARRGELVTRVYVPERSQRVVLALDTGRGMGLVSGERSLFDHAADASMRLTREVLRQGDGIALLAFDHERRARVPLSRGPAALMSVGAALADIDARREATDFHAFFREIAGEHRRRSLIVVMTELGLAEQRRNLQRSVATLNRRHLLLVVDLLDPALDSLQYGVPETVDDFFASAAAVELLNERRAAAARLRAAGIPVVAEHPDRVGGALQNRYLDLKRAGAL